MFDGTQRDGASVKLKSSETLSFKKFKILPPSQNLISLSQFNTQAASNLNWS